MFIHCPIRTYNFFFWKTEQVIERKGYNSFSVACPKSPRFTILGTYAPSERKSRPLKLRMPWFNESNLVARQHRRKAERIWRKTRLESDRKLFIEAHENVCRVITVTKEKFLKDKLGSCTVKEVYRIIHSLLNKKSSHLPLCDSASRLAE